MSRIGNNPIAIPEGVTVEVKDNVVTVKGKLGELTQNFDTVDVKVEEGNVEEDKPDGEKKDEDKEGEDFNEKRLQCTFREKAEEKEVRLLKEVAVAISSSCRQERTGTSKKKHQGQC